jgi:hypothetical protein
LTKEQLDLAHKCASELSMYAKAINQYGNGERFAACMRNAASLLLQMIAEAEVKEGALREIKDQYLNPDQASAIAKAGLRQENDDVFPGFRGNNDSA